jgi:hypothetical protein
MSALHGSDMEDAVEGQFQGTALSVVCSRLDPCQSTGIAYTAITHGGLFEGSSFGRAEESIKAGEPDHKLQL